MADVPIRSADRDEGVLTIGYPDARKLLLRGALVSLAIMLFAVPTVYSWAVRQPAQFRATATVLVPTGAQRLPSLGGAAFAPLPLDLGAYRVAVVSDHVLSDALRSLGVDEPTNEDRVALRAALSTSITVGLRDSSLLRVQAEGPTPRLAVDRADATAAAVAAWDQSRVRADVGRIVEALEDQIAVLDGHLRAIDPGGTELDGADRDARVAGMGRLRAERLLQLANARAWSDSIGGTLQLLASAEATLVQTAPRPVLQVLVASLLAVAIGYGGALLRAALGAPLGRIQDAGGLPVLVALPPTRDHGEEKLAPVAARLREMLAAATPGTRRRTFLVTSAGAREGRSTVARLLAQSFARAGVRTLLVDSDLRSPVQASHLVLGATEAYRGPTTEAWLRDPDAAGAPGWVVAPGVGRLHMVVQPHPVANPADLVARGFAAALSRWSDFDVVVIDAPAILAASESLVIASLCSGSVWVIDSRRGDPNRVEEAIAIVRRSGARILGAVMNRVETAAGMTAPAPAPPWAAASHPPPALGPDPKEVS